MKLILIGFMGAGKSSVAQCLGESLALDVFEMDALILERSTRSSIPAIFAEDGEAHFRQLEAEVAQELGGLNSGVISTGGGIIGKADNIEALRKGGGLVIYLQAPFEILEARVASNASQPRPLFADPHAAKALWEARLPLYEQHADLVIESTAHPPQQLAAMIVAALA